MSRLCLKSQQSNLEEVSTTRGSGWVRSHKATFNHLVKAIVAYTLL